MPETVERVQSYYDDDQLRGRVCVVCRQGHQPLTAAGHAYVETGPGTVLGWPVQAHPACTTRRATA